MNDVLDVEVVDEPGADLVPAESSSLNLWRTNDPVEVLKRAQNTADALMPVIRDKGLVADIQGREYLKVEAWVTLGAMLGVSPVCTWTRKLENGWEARVEARTLDGRVIGAAEAECLTAESQWSDADDFAVRSMAQTRATSKSLASVLRFVATLGGAAGTPAEEIPRDGGSSRRGFASPKQQDFFERLLKEAGGSAETVNAIVLYAQVALSGERDGPISKAIDGLKGSDPKATGKRLAEEAKTWEAKQSDVPADTEGLEDVPIETQPGDEDIPF